MQFRGRLSERTTTAKIDAPIFNRKGRRRNRWCYAVTLLVFAVGVLWAGMPTLTNLRLAADQFGVEKDIVAFTVNEGRQGNTDLNGDLDDSDRVLHVYDAKKGTIVNLGLDARDLVVEKKRVAFRVEEERQGDTDLNGDSDAESDDNVLHVYDVKKDIMTNLGLAAESDLQMEKDRVAFRVDERAQGETDFNGDADSDDSVLHVYDAKKGTITNVGLAAVFGIQMEKGRIVFRVSEEDQGDSDLNGDGDEDSDDRVLHVYDARKGTLTNVGLAASDNFQMEKDLVAFLVDEQQQGNTELNDDGFADSDRVLHVYDAKKDITTNLRLAARNGFQIEKRRVAFAVHEGAQGNTDLNGDLDTSDSVLHVYDAKKGTITNVGLAANSIQMAKDWVAFRVPEGAQGGTNLNGDLDANDQVLHVYNAKTGVVTNVGLAADSIRMEKDRVAFRVGEEAQGDTDLNGNGDADSDERVIHVYDAKKGTTTNLGLVANSDLQMEKDSVSFRVEEQRQGSDLNGDGDADSDEDVLHVYDAKKGIITNVGLAAERNFQMEKHRVVFRVNENDQGNMDLNDDSDSGDRVIHVYETK